MYTPRLNPNPSLTTFLVNAGLFRSNPFCLVDVGASGGIDEYWNVFGDSLRAFGFDGLVSEMERLNQAAAKTDQHYYGLLVGDKGYVPPQGVPDTQPFQRTSAAKAAEITSCNYAKTYFDKTGKAVYTREMIELDQFFLRDRSESVDFIKIDTDGFDYQVLRGAREMLSRADVLGLGIECQFHGLVHEESNTFRNVDRFLTGLGYSLFDVEVHRYTRSALPRPFVYSIPAQTHGGQVLWGDALYLRDLGQKDYEANWGLQFSVEKITKLGCLFELFGLEDCAAELLLKYRAQLAPLLDVDASLDMLATEVNGRRISYRKYFSAFERNPASFYPDGPRGRVAAPVEARSFGSPGEILSPAKAYWAQRFALAQCRDRILSLSQAVNKQCDLWLYQWAQLMAVALEYQPDVILELGRGTGNSTCVFTEASNQLNGRTRVVSVCLSEDWGRLTVPRLRNVVPPEWFEPLRIVRTEIDKLNYETALGAAKRVLIFWDAHGFDIAECVFGKILPVVAPIEHLVIMHDLSDTRYSADEQLDYRGHGLWKGNNWDGPRLKLGIVDSATEQSVAAVDFTTRNHLTLDSADHSFRTELTTEQQSEMKGLLGDLFDLQAHWFYFSLNEKPGPYKFPRFTPTPNAGRNKKHWYGG